MSQYLGNGAQNTGWYRNLATVPTTTSSGLSEPWPALDSNRRPTELILPKGYTDRDFGNLLSSVVESPELLASGAMVNVLPATAPALNTNSNSLRFNTESQIAPGFKIFAPGSERWSYGNGNGNGAPTITESDAHGNGSETGSSPPESVVGEPTEDTITPATIGYEITEDTKLLKLMSSATPLELVIGGKQNEMCIACFHVGHHHTDFDTCPTARISSLFSESGPYYSRLPEKKKARVLLMKDIGWACQGLSWAIQYVCQGYMKEFQIFPGTVSQLHKLLHRWKSVIHDERFTFGACGGEITFGEPFQIAPVQSTSVQSTQGPSNQIQLKKKPLRVETLPGGDAGIGNNFLNSFMIPKTVKQKTECDADRLQLPVLGNRPAAICTHCLHRGHAKSSIKICPYLIVSLATEKLKSGKRRQDNVSNEIECLKNVVDRMTGESELKKVEPIISLLAEWNEATANFSPKGKKTRAPKTPRGQFTGVPLDFQAYGPPTVFPNRPSQTPSIRNPNHLSLTPSYNRDHVQNFSNPFPEFSQPSSPPLNSPFGENENSKFYDLQFGSECFTSPTSLQESRTPGDFQPENTEFPTLTNPFPSLEIETGELSDEEGMQILFENDSSLSMLDNFPSHPVNASRPSDHEQIDNSFSAISQIDTQNQLDNTIPPPEQDWSQSTLSQPTYTSALSSQQSNNPPIHENNRTNSKYNLADELPPEIFWRTRCPLKVIGNRGDSFCKICLHYGHDKRSQSCLVNVVRIAIAANKLQRVLAVSETIKDLEAGVKWQRNLPEEMQGDDNMILNLIRRWKETADSLRKAEDNSESDTDFRDPKRLCPSNVLRVPVRQHQSPRKAATTQQQMQMDREIEHFAPNVGLSPKGQLPQVYQSQSPRRIAPGIHQTQSWMHPPQQQSFPQPLSPQQQSFPQLLPAQQQPFPQPLPAQQQSFPQPSPSQQQLFSQPSPSQQQSFPQPPPAQQYFTQQPFQSRPFVQQQETTVAPRGWAIDYSRMDSDLFTKISDYIISDGDPADSDNLRVDNQKMPPMLIVAIRKFVIPESLVQKPLVLQPVMHQQQDQQPQLHGGQHLQDIGQRYNSQIQTPKRKRN